MNYRKKQSKVDKFTLREMKRQKREDSLKGDGEYLFVNNTRGELTLLKKPIKSPIPTNPCMIPPGQTFVGDNYFNVMMKTGEIRLVEVIKPAANERTGIMEEKKLILDQPGRFTNQGQTEHVVPDDKTVKPLIENKPTQAQPVEKLITEDPIDGVEILLG